jgi:hypothetical protein
MSPVADPSRGEDQNPWKQIWWERLTAARKIHEVAVAHFTETVERAQAKKWKHEVDGVVALRKAKTVERLALENYLEVLKIYTTLMVDGRLPESSCN